MNNYLCEYTCITRKATLSCHIYDILSLYGEERRKGYDCHGRQATHARRGSRESSTICENSQEVYPLRTDRGSPGRQPLPSKRVGARPLSSQKYQTGNGNRRQKIKPPERWQTRQFTAVRLLLRFSRPGRSSPSIDLPTFSITCCPRTRQWLYEGGYTRGRYTYE